MVLTDKEFNEYLISIDGLINANNGEKILNTDFFQIGQGWNLLVKNLIEDLIALGWDKQICQVKEKFGGLRLYINAGSDAVFDRISKAERDSYDICEVCGEKGEMRRDLGWYLTLCDNHYQEKLNKKNGK